MTWIAIDWGTTNLRAYLMNENEVVNLRHSPKGMAGLSAYDFEPALMSVIEDWLDGPTEVWMAGMVGARGGWQEVPYTALPVEPKALIAQTITARAKRLDLRIVPGVSQLSPHADVMRGEETQIAGLLSLDPNFEGIVCLPGTHTKWVHVSAEEIISFQTFMTGELHAMASSSAVLQPALEGDGWDAEAFDFALSQSISRPEIMAAKLFGLRASFLLTGQSAATAKATLSGLLIGAELAASKPYWLGQNVAIIGAPEVARHYEVALKLQGVPVQTHDAQSLTPQGLAYLRNAAQQKDSL